MKLHVTLALLVCLAATTPRLTAQEGVLSGDPAKGASLLEEARKAVGGADKLAAVKTLQVKGMFRRTFGNNQMDGEFEILIQSPDKMKRTDDMSLPGGGPSMTMVQGLNGSEVWDENSGGGRGFGFGGFRGGFGGGRPGGDGGGFGGRPGGDGPPAGAPPDAQAGQGAPNIDPERLRQLQLQQRQGDLSRLMVAWLLSTDASVAWVATAESPEGKADVLELKPATGQPLRLFLDQSSHMPLMLTWQGNIPQFGRGGRRGGGDSAPSNAGGQGDQAPPQGAAGAQPQRGGPGGPQATLQLTLADYKTVNGIKLPHLMTRGVSGQTNEEWTISSYKVNPSFKSNTFDKKK